MSLADGSHSWWEISWVDWVAVVGTVLALFGIWQAWRQARAAVSASNAAKRAATATERQLQANQLLVLIPQLRFISSELDLSIRENDTRYAGMVLSNWRFQANAVRGILSASEDNVDVVLTFIQKSVTLAATASGKLLEGGSEVHTITRQVRKSVGEVVDELTAWSGRAAMTSESEGAA